MLAHRAATRHRLRPHARYTEGGSEKERMAGRLAGLAVAALPPWFSSLRGFPYQAAKFARLLYGSVAESERFPELFDSL